MMAALLAQEFNEPPAAAKVRLEMEILTKSFKHKSGLAPCKTRVFLKRVLPRWQDRFTMLLMVGFSERACALLKTGAKSGHGTRGDIPDLQQADALACLKGNWFFTTANGREALNFGTEYAFRKLGCLSTVQVAATENEAAYLKMRTGLYGRIVSTVRLRPTSVLSLHLAPPVSRCVATRYAEAGVSCFTSI